MDRKVRKDVKDIEKRLAAARPAAAADPAELPEHAALLVRAGEVYRAADRLPEATGCLAEALAVYRRLDDRTGEAQALVAMSSVLRAQARFAEAAECCHQALAIATDLGWESARDMLQWRIAALTAAEQAGIDVPDELVKAALHGPGDGSDPNAEYWVYEVDQRRVKDDHAPPEAIIRAWQVGSDGLLTGLVVPNTNYRAGRGR